MTRRSSYDPKVLVGAGQAQGKYDYAILPINGGDMDPRGDSYRYFSIATRSNPRIQLQRGIYQDSPPITLFKSLCETRILVKRRKMIIPYKTISHISHTHSISMSHVKYSKLHISSKFHISSKLSTYTLHIYTYIYNTKQSNEVFTHRQRRELRSQFAS